LKIQFEKPTKALFDCKWSHIYFS